MNVRSSPIVALNRAITIGQRDGPEGALKELRTIADSERLANCPFYHAAFGEFELRSGRPELAHEHLSTALKISHNPMERQFFERRLNGAAAQLEVIDD